MTHDPHLLTDGALAHSIDSIRTAVLILESEHAKLLDEQRRRRGNAIASREGRKAAGLTRDFGTDSGSCSMLS